MSSIQMRVTIHALRNILRLPENVTIIDAGYGWLAPRRDDADVLVLTLEMPGAPEGAAEVTPIYSRNTELPDPVSLTGYQWLRADGTEIKQESGSGSG